VVNSCEDNDPVEAAAWSAAAKAYVPYSHFHVGAAVRTSTRAIYAGCNVENASYSLTLCAERNAVAAAVTAEGPKAAIEEVVVVTPDSKDCAPCGACRQVLIEFGRSLRVRFLQDGKLMEATSGDLMPYAFTDADLP
jgi:cytidine deaminase